MLIYQLGNDEYPVSEKEFKKFSASVKSGKDFTTHLPVKIHRLDATVKGCTRIFQIGSANRPCTEEDIKDFNKTFKHAKENNQPMIIPYPIWTHNVYENENPDCCERE